MIQDLSGSWCIKGTGESMTRVDSPVPLMHHDPDRSWITDPDPGHPIISSGTKNPNRLLSLRKKFSLIVRLRRNKQKKLINIVIQFPAFVCVL